MPWLRLSDTAAHDPRVVAVLEHPDADERTADELFGFMLRLATLSAQHATDYVASYATALAIAGTRSRADRLLTLAEFAGYGVNEVETETGRRRFRLVDDPQFIHMKTAEEIAFESQRKTDNGSPHITVPVRMRDGDACRYCGRVVSWSDRTGGIGGTYDHRPPGRPATPQTAVVACRSCNSARGAIGQGMAPEAALEAADAVHPLWDVPLVPYYKPATRVWLGKHADILAQHSLTPPPPAKSKRVVPAGTAAPGTADPSTAAEPSSADPAPTGVRPAAPAPGADTQPQKGAVSSDNAPPADHLPRRQVDGLPKLDMPGRVGTGRGGPGLEGAGRDGGPPPAPTRRRRGRRGGSKTRPQAQAQPQGETR